jgi:peroxiredoxin
VTSFFYVTYLALWVLVIFQTLVLLGVTRTVYRRDDHGALESSRHNDDIPIGELAPRFTALDISGSRIDEKIFDRTLTALLFVSPGCSTCTATLSEVEALRQRINGDVVIVCQAAREECGRLSEMYGLGTPVLVDENSIVSERFGVRATPTAVLVGPTGRILTSGYPMHGEELARLFSESERPEFQEAH